MIDNNKNYTPLSPTLLHSPSLSKEQTEKYFNSSNYGRIPTALTPLVAEVHKKRRMAKRQELKRRNLVTINKEGKIKRNDKLNVFLEEFLKNGGNATQAALAVGNYASLSGATAMGSHYMKQARGLARLYLEKKGYGYGKMLEKAAKKMDESKSPEWWDRLMKLSDYHDFLTKDKSPQTAIVNVIQSHKDLTSSYIEGESDMEEIENGTEDSIIEENESAK